MSIALFVASTSSQTFARVLTIDDRVAAQRAIEQVYWSHRIWPKENPGPKPRLSDVLPDDAIRARVDDYLQMSNALERWWRRPVTAEQLQAELDRTAKNTRDRAMLQELFHALGDDPAVIAETLARQTLVDRLIRSWYAVDTRFHVQAKASAEAALAGCTRTDCIKTAAGDYRETTFRLVDASTEAALDVDVNGAVPLDANAWSSRLRHLRAGLGTTAELLPKGRLGPLEETPEAFVVTAVVAQGKTTMTTATAVWPKRTFDDWWSAERSAVGSRIEQPSGSFALPTLPSTACANDTWSPTRADVPDPRMSHTAVWTGTEMIVWGGLSSENLNTGGCYNPSTDSWTITSTGANAPAARVSHTAVWTGTEMIVWGGGDAAFFHNGGRYNPGTNTWTASSLTDGSGFNVPTGRSGHTATWTGTEMIVWGGGNGTRLNTGGRYNPVTDSWAVCSLTAGTGANVASGRSGHSAVWTGTELVVWGG